MTQAQGETPPEGFDYAAAKRYVARRENEQSCPVCGRTGPTDVEGPTIWWLRCNHHVSKSVRDSFGVKDK